jgi:hypothetical protein
MTHQGYFFLATRPTAATLPAVFRDVTRLGLVDTALALPSDLAGDCVTAAGVDCAAAVGFFAPRTLRGLVTGAAFAALVCFLPKLGVATPVSISTE